jgi:hypothetical protein
MGILEEMRLEDERKSNFDDFRNMMREEEMMRDKSSQK